MKSNYGAASSDEVKLRIVKQLGHMVEVQVVVNGALHILISNIQQSKFSMEDRR